MNAHTYVLFQSMYVLSTLISYRCGGGHHMATESFYQDMVIDTREAAERLEALLEEGSTFIPSDLEINFNDPEIIRRFGENYQ